MSKHIRRYGRRNTRYGNWFMRLALWQRVVLATVVILVCILAAAAAYVAIKWNKIDTQEIKADDLIINQEVKEQASLDLGEGYKNIALFGVDSRDGNLGEGNRTDCIIIASLNNETKEIKMVSVYRDTLLDLSDGTYQKCNAAYSYGGPVMAINMLNLNLDLDIEDYITVDFGAIADAIDLLGGVEIDVTDEEVQYLNQFLQETADSAGTEAHFLSESGLQLLDGTQATTYARIRSTAGGDFTRTERQRLVISKMFEKARKADLATLNEIIDEVFPQVSTSFTLSEILKYVTGYSEYVLEENRGFPEQKFTVVLPETGDVVVPDNLADNVKSLHEFLFSETNYIPSSQVQSTSANITALAGTGTSESNSSDYYDDGSGMYDSSGYYDGSSGYYDDSSGMYDSGDYYDSGSVTNSSNDEYGGNSGIYDSDNYYDNSSMTNGSGDNYDGNSGMYDSDSYYDDSSDYYDDSSGYYDDESGDYDSGSINNPDTFNADTLEY